jgi:hypothetical protein
LLIPYVSEYVPFMRRVQRALDRHTERRVLRSFGFGMQIVATTSR